MSCPTNRDLIKLGRLVSYSRRTLNDIRIIGARDLRTLLTWIDASYAVHMNMRRQTGGTMSFGTEIIHAKSSKQKLYSKSSTEYELIGVSEYLPYHIWVENFLENQGYKIPHKILYQDNQITIR